MLRDQIFNHPGSMLAGCFIWVPIGIWVLSLVQWAVQGDVDVLSALAGVCLGIGLGMTAMLAREPYMAPLILTAVVLTMAAFPVVRGALNKRALEQIDVEAIERAYTVLAQNPTNAAARFKLAKTIYNKGMASHALAIAEDAILHMPAGVFPEEHRILKSWRHYAKSHGSASAIDCMNCGTANPPGSILCAKCHGRFLLDYARGSWVGSGTAKKFVGAWIVMVVALVGIPFAAGSFPSAVAIPVIIALMAVAIVVLVGSFWGAKDPAR